MNTLKLSIGKYIFFAAILGVVIPLFIHGTEQGDFKTFYAGSSAFKQNLNPYDTSNLSKIMGGTSSIAPYVYPPMTLLLFEPLTLFQYQTASILYLVIKLLSLFLLTQVWLKIYPFQKYESVFFIVCLFAFGGTIFADLRSGNISIFEQLLIWAGFFFYLKKKPLYFTATIVLASLFKFFPILLLGLLLLSFNRKETTYAISGIIVFLLIIYSNYFFSPKLFSSFFESANGLLITASQGERGKFNSSTLTFFQDAFFIIKTKFSLPEYIPTILYLFVITIATVPSLLAFRKLRNLDNKINASLWKISLLCFLYGIILPRFKDYSYILLIAPAFYIMLQSFRQKLFIPFFLFFLIFMTYKSYGALGNQLLTLENQYYSLLVTWIIFFIALFEIFRLSKSDIAYE